MLYYKDETPISTKYSSASVIAHEVVKYYENATQIKL